MNKFKNEFEITLGSEKLLLRPTFENMANTETHVGGLSYLAWKLSKGALRDTSGKVNIDMNATVRGSLTLTECAQIIFFNQAASHPDDSTKKLYSLEEIWEKVQAQGISVIAQVTMFIITMVGGQKNKIEESGPEEKKT